MKTKQKGPRPKHIPQRTCIACRSVESKRGLVRVVRTPLGAIEIDPTGKKSGRGAYLCSTRACWDNALKRKALEQALKVTISPENREQLVAFKEALPVYEGGEDGGLS